MEKIRELKLSDLINITAFEAWARKHINIYNEKEVPDEHLNIFLQYIEDQVRKENFPYDRLVWFKTIERLKGRLIKHEQFKE